MNTEKCTKGKNSYWQEIRAVCILAVVLIHALSGFDYSGDNIVNLARMILRQVINFPVVVFIFLSGFFVKVSNWRNGDAKKYIISRGSRLVIPFVLWSAFYTLLTIMRNVSDGVLPDIKELFVSFITGNAATPLYYIVVLIQLTIITPILLKLIDKRSKSLKWIWWITPIYLIYIYVYILIHNELPFLYGTLFPAWLGFYYFGIVIHVERDKINTFVKKLGQPHWVIITCLLAFFESICLRELGYNESFYMSQIRFFSYLYSISVVCLFLNREHERTDATKSLVYVGDVSYGIFYVHYFFLMISGKLFSKFDFYGNWIGYWGSRLVLSVLGSLLLIYIVKVICNIFKIDRVLKWIGFV